MFAIKKLVRVFPSVSRLMISSESSLVPDLRRKGFVYKKLKSFFADHPLIANSLSMGTLYMGAELCQQTLNYRFKKWQTSFDETKQCPPKLVYDMDTAKNFGILGTAVFAPLFQVWYKWLDSKFVGTGAKIIAKKCFLDEIFFGPPCLLIFYVGMSFLEGEKDLFAELKKKFFHTYACDCMFWVPVQVVNFLMISPTFRVLYLGLASFVWLNILCVIKNIENYVQHDEHASDNLGY